MYGWSLMNCSPAVWSRILLNPLCLCSTLPTVLFSLWCQLFHRLSQHHGVLYKSSYSVRKATVGTLPEWKATWEPPSIPPPACPCCRSSAPVYLLSPPTHLCPFLIFSSWRSLGPHESWLFSNKVRAMTLEFRATGLNVRWQSTLRAEIFVFRMGRW